MILASMHKVSKSFAGDLVFEDISLQIKSGEKIALVGRNGVGKTTIFRLLIGAISVDSGEITRVKGLKIGYLPQEMKLDRGWTLLDEVNEAFRDLIKMQKRIVELENMISRDEADDADMTEYGTLQERFEREGGFTYTSRIEDVLTGLGFPIEEFHKPLSLFSGGEKNRAYLARLLLSDPDLLLLDEPTNHLDIESTEWLENYLNELDTAALIVSHDRVFLNRTTGRTFDLKQNHIDIYAGNYDFYVRERSAREELQSKAYERQTEEINRIRDFIQRNIAGQKTRQAQSRRRMLSKLKRLASPEKEQRTASVRIESSGRSHLKLLEVDDVSKSFHGRVIFSGVSFKIERGQKVGLIGPNGSGKSTLVKIITGELDPDSGEVRIGGNVTPAYFDQELSIINEDETVIDSVWEEKPDAEAGELRSYLGGYLFSGDDVFKKVAALSGGEKSRLALAKIFLLPANFLILDEPTNHLDLQSCEKLEDALDHYDGAALVVSHDRFFLEKTVTSILSLENGSLTQFAGSYNEFVEWKEKQNRPHVTAEDMKEAAERKHERIENWQTLKERRRIRKQFEKLEEDIHSTEKSIEETDALLLDESIQSDWEKLSELQERKKNLEERLIALLEEYDEFE